MRYLLLIIEDRDRRRQRPPGQAEAEFERMTRFGDELKRRGILEASESLKEIADGVRVMVRNGKRTAVDGPFIETMVGGFFLLDCESREQALTIAGECPAVEWGTVELREIGPCYED